jgi:hypothetical protein
LGTEWLAIAPDFIADRCEKMLKAQANAGLSAANNSGVAYWFLLRPGWSVVGVRFGFNPPGGRDGGAVVLDPPQPAAVRSRLTNRRQARKRRMKRVPSKAKGLKAPQRGR